GGRGEDVGPRGKDAVRQEVLPRLHVDERLRVAEFGAAEEQGEQHDGPAEHEVAAEGFVFEQLGGEGLFLGQALVRGGGGGGRGSRRPFRGRGSGGRVGSFGNAHERLR